MPRKTTARRLQRLHGHLRSTIASSSSKQLFLVAQVSHETNTYSPVVTDLARFEPKYGEDVRKLYEGTRSGVGAFLKLATEAGAAVVTPFAGAAPPSGVVLTTAFDHMCDSILTSIKSENPTALMLCLHGAMVTEAYEDGEGELLRRIRAVAPDTPIAITLDMHCNMHSDIASCSNTLAGYYTYPHEDGYETALRAGSSLLKMLRNEVQPVTAWGNRPMIPHVMRQSTLEPYNPPGSEREGKAFKTPNKAIQARAQQMEKYVEGCLNASVFVGFPHADIQNAGMSAVVVTDGDEELAHALCEELLDMCWAARHDFIYNPEPLDAAMARARRIGNADAEGGGGEEGGEGENKPVILLDHCDNVASGGTMDTTAVLAACIEADLEDAVFYGIFDPASVSAMFEAGVGAQVSLELGGKVVMPAMPSETASPLSVTGTVITLDEGGERDSGWGKEGPAGVLRVGGIDICVVSKHLEPNNLRCMQVLGIDPLSKRFLVLKSRVHWQNSRGFGPIYKAVVECDGVGVCGSDYSKMEFKQLRRPIFPLELGTEAEGNSHSSSASAYPQPVAKK